MEIQEPVILVIPQGRRTVRLEITTRADVRDLMTVLARRIQSLPDDGTTLNDLVMPRLGPDGSDEADVPDEAAAIAAAEPAIEDSLAARDREPRSGSAVSEPGPDPLGPPPEVLAKTAARGLVELTARLPELVPRDESLPWAPDASMACGWSGPDSGRCQLYPHGARVEHAAMIGAATMRRWPALRSVIA